MDYSFHISHASLGCENGLDFTSNLVAIHAVVDDADYVLCYLGMLPNSEVPVIQQSLNLDITDGEEIMLYMDSVSGKKGNLSCVHLTGYVDGFDAVESESEEEDLLTASPPATDTDEEDEQEDLAALPPTIEELSVRTWLL